MSTPWTKCRAPPGSVRATTSRPLTPAEVSAGPPAPAPELPFRIIKGKRLGATPGFEVVDARGQKYLLKLDPGRSAGAAQRAGDGRPAHLSCSRIQRAGLLPGRLAAGPGSATGSRRDLPAVRRAEAAPGPGAGAIDAGPRRPGPGWAPARGGRALASRRDRRRLRHDRTSARRSQRPHSPSAPAVPARQLVSVRLDLLSRSQRHQHRRQLRGGAGPAIHPPLLHRLRGQPGRCHARQQVAPPGRRGVRRGGANAGVPGLAGAVSAALPGRPDRMAPDDDKLPVAGVVPRGVLQSRRVPVEPEDPGACPPHGARRVLGRQAGHLVLGCPDRRHRGHHRAGRSPGGLPGARPEGPAGHHRPSLLASGHRGRAAPDHARRTADLLP